MKRDKERRTAGSSPAAWKVEKNRAPPPGSSISGSLWADPAILSFRTAFIVLYYNRFSIPLQVKFRQGREAGAEKRPADQPARKRCRRGYNRRDAAFRRRASRDPMARERAPLSWRGGGGKINLTTLLTRRACFAYTKDA